MMISFLYPLFVLTVVVPSGIFLELMYLISGHFHFEFLPLEDEVMCSAAKPMP